MYVQWRHHCVEMPPRLTRHLVTCASEGTWRSRLLSFTTVYVLGNVDDSRNFCDEYHGEGVVLVVMVIMKTTMIMTVMAIMAIIV